MMMFITAVNLQAASGEEVFQDENTFLHFRFYKKFMGKESVLHCSKRNFDHDVYHRVVNMGAARSKQVFPCGKEQFASFYKKSIYKKFIQIKNVPHRIKRNFDDDLLHHGVNMRAARGKQVLQYKNTFFHFQLYKKFIGINFVSHR